MRLAFEDDFFDANPALGELREEISACKLAYQGDAASRRCRCGGDPRLILGCLGALLARLESLRAEDPATLAPFFAYVGAKHNRNVSSVTIYYRGTAQTPLRKIRLP
jgi:hypothetical protein